MSGKCLWNSWNLPARTAPCSFLPQTVKLTSGAVVMRLRNVSPRAALCYGTRKIVKQVRYNELLKVTVICGREIGYIPRTTTVIGDVAMGFRSMRDQFTLGLAVAVRINKAPGLTVLHACGDMGKEQKCEERGMMEQFTRHAQVLDVINEKRERLVKASRDVTIHSKKVIFQLHRISAEKREEILNQAEKDLEMIRTQQISRVASELQGDEYWKFRRAYSPGNGGDYGVVGANGEVLPIEVRAPDFEGVNHGEEFLLVGGVVHLHGKELLACEGDGVFAGWGLGVGGGVFDGGGFGGVARKMLREDGSNGEVRCISGNVQMSRGVGDLEDRGRGDGLFEEVEGVLAAVVPIEGLVLACEFVEWVRDVGEVADEGAAMLSMESVRMLDISLLDDWAMVGEEVVVAADEVAATAEVLAADEVEAAATAAVSAAALPRPQQCHVSSATSATVPRQQCHVSNAMSAVPRQQQCHVNSATSAVPCQQCHISSATSATVPRQQCPATMTGVAPGMPGQLANESIADYKQRFQTQLTLIEAEEQRQLAAEAARLQAEAAATAEKQRLQAEAEADTQSRRKEAQHLLQRHEATSIEKLKYWHFEPSEGHDDAAPEEQHREFMPELVTRLVYACNHLQSELENMQRAMRNHKAQHEDAERALDSRVQDLEQTAPRPEAGESSNAPSARQLEERVDHVVAMLGDISTFAAPATVSQQLDTLKTEIRQRQQPSDPDRSTSTAKHYKMPTFQIEKFDDYTLQDPVVWWQGFTTELGIHEVPKHLFIGALFLNVKGGCQIWLSHMATVHGVEVFDLHTKVSWEDLTKEWKKRFIVDDAPALAMNRIFTMAQGNTATRDWLTDWQKIVATPDLDLPFPHLRREFYNRSCAALSLALGDREQYNTFAEIINKAREIIKTNRAAAHQKSTWQPTYVEKVKTGSRPQQFAAVQSDNIVEDPAATQASREGDQVAAVQPRSNNKSRGNGKAKTASSAGNGQPAPWHQAQDLPLPGSGQGGCSASHQLGKLSCVGGETTPPLTPPDSAALLAASYTSGEDANVVSSQYADEDYAVHLVPPLDQPLHVQQSTACTVSSPSTTNSAVSPPSAAGDSTSWSRLEELNLLTFADFQWMPLPRSDRMPKPHCNVLMAQLRDYLHTAVPTPLMDAGVEVVDLPAYIAKIDREFKTQQYDDIDAPLLCVRIQIGEATCSALIDWGASRNYMSQDFMVRAGLGPHVRRKSRPTQVTLAEGHTHKSIDRCIDDVPGYFAPHASEVVSFDILDTKFDMILGMSWLRSEDHPVNFYRRTVHVRDRNGVLVPCTVAPPHPSISCHVVSAASMRASIIKDDIEEMGVCFLNVLPPHDASSTDSSSDPRITELLDAYGDVFEGPHGVVPDRPIRHEIILEDGAVPPRGCIYRMSEEELSVLRAQLDDLLEKGWIRPSSSPYGAPVLFVWKKNKDLRLCIDYRKLNAQTIRNAGPLPRIDDLLERVGGAKFFSKLNLKSGYHQLEIRQEDRYKTAFKTRYGHFEWLVMPFGPTNAPATFQAAMTTEFRHMLDRFVLIYLDDILVYNRSLNEHVEHLRTVLERLRQAKYKADRDKCEFARQELEYLGHYVTPQGIRPLANKIEALHVWPEPTNTTDVRSFMGLAGYYQRFITGYLRIVAPMTRLQSPKVPFVFDDDACRSFQALRTAMLMAPVLSIYDPTLPTRVTTGASDYGIGAVLEQHGGDDWHPVEYFSHKVPPINSLDDARKKELLAFVMALKRWRHFLLGCHRFTWVTDNNPLTYYKTEDTVSSTIGRWMYFIDQFDFTPKYLPGLSNRTADALSRRPDLCAMTHHAFAFDEELQRHFIRGYESDPNFATLYAQLSSDHPPTSHYHIVDGYLLLHLRGKDLLCVPRDRCLRTRLLGEYHGSGLAGHFGVNRTIARLRQRFRWPDLITDVTRYCDSCEVCRRSKPRNGNPYGELRPMPIPREPGLSIAMDVTGPFPRDRLGHDGILTVVDHLNIVSDRDTRFMSAFWTALMQEAGTKMKPSSARHPQTDGQTERAHQTAQMMLHTLIRPDQKDWVDRLPDIEFAYNTSVHPAIGVTPFELHHGGRKCCIFADLLLPRPADLDAACSPASVRKYRELLAQALANMEKAQVRMQQQANMCRVPCPIRAGDLVWVSAEEFALEQDVQEYVEAASLSEFCKHGSLLMYTQVNDSFSEIRDAFGDPFTISVADYVLGLADLTGELMRLAVSGAGSGKQVYPARDVGHFVGSMYHGFNGLPKVHENSHDMFRKVEVMRESLLKIEKDQNKNRPLTKYKIA
ncbi:hypothetical protein CBR_g489 [Chara braunii]|uniref:Reverse transcriptase n=1 Tax=Chara braunii TaxID=69332 RepID=A0A388KBB3_CHABU|nr:hypothetical protein CBR_g489 [Chara braunii]|eukprot:GBG67352.1 hypothetical protein CBR_g489 [Chara braunii]